MREIKFRAWNKKHKKMYQVHRLEVDDSSPKALELDSETRIYTNDKDCILMQFTGLLDKNGKEIYEGDIVKVNQSIGIYDPYSGKTGEVKYMDDGSFRIFIQGMSTHPFVIRTKEIIGNIYENPELLKKPQH